MKFKRQKRDRLTIDMTSLIDVVFLLLIFFMVTTTFTEKTELKIDLPEAQGNMQMEAPKNAIEVVIDSNGEYSVNGEHLINSHFSTIKSAIAKLAGDDTKRPFLITADGQAPHQAVVRVMDAAGQLGLVNISITTIRPSE